MASSFSVKNIVDAHSMVGCAFASSRTCTLFKFSIQLNIISRKNVKADLFNSATAKRCQCWPNVWIYSSIMKVCGQRARSQGHQSHPVCTERVREHKVLIKVWAREFNSGQVGPFFAGDVAGRSEVVDLNLDVHGVKCRRRGDTDMQNLLKQMIIVVSALISSALSLHSHTKMTVTVRHHICEVYEASKLDLQPGPKF